ncbi:hypothetical protein [Pelagicoccus mobilis]|uniref:Glycoside hydrolase family 42 N-terminal domain-containing protein n=1 Tax=Pelagicoccus mobilis TaxID=415221 RepID=A0A934S4I9_9BACT|nr:hypothetical protein [Pelagicoccus mobilis]MBK1879642.1 hypothetical protein [Pelagicoccus mobilis]
MKLSFGSSTALALGLCFSSVIAAGAPLDISKETFRNPPNEYRITQYQLTPQTLKKYPQYGVGGVMGFFYSALYPESGKLAYDTGGKGAAVIGDLVDAARAIDYKVWLADDWGYPSGSAGGRVVAENPEFEVKSLTMLSVSGNGPERIDYELPQDLHDIVYATLYPVKGGKIALDKGRRVSAAKKSLQTKGLKGSWELRVFARYVRDKDTQGQSTMRQFGHAGRYPDLMNREAMSRFIANMHAPILAQIDDPANQVEGFYCNEPNLMQTHWKGGYDAPYACAPWTDELPEYFEEMHRYELFSVLPAIFEGNDDQARRARIHYRQAVANLLTESFAVQIREWCNERGIKSSGHYLLNQFLSMHVQGYGDMMKFVSEFDVPALDIPIPNPDEFRDFAYQQTRFFSSVGVWKERGDTIMLLDPIIGGYGRSRLSPRLPLLLNSVNMASFHGANIFTSYLPFEATRKKTFTNGHENKATGYTKEEYRFFNEYTGRMTQVLRGARRDAGVGLYYPISMFQADLLASDKFWPTIKDLYQNRQDNWDNTEKALLDGDIEYMILHPEAVSEAEIEDGWMKIGYGAYHTLVMPHLELLPLAVADQLERFEASGGKVIWVGQVPGGGEYARNDSVVRNALRDADAIAVDELAGAIENSYSTEFDLSFTPGTEHLTVGRFHRNGEQVYLLVNREQEGLEVTVEGHRAKNSSGRIQVLDPSTGEISKVKLPARFSMGANRALMLIPEAGYLSGKLGKN